MHGGVAKDDLKNENAAAVAKGCDNLKRHIENVNKFGVPAVVAVNKFITDTDAEITEVMKAAESMGTKAFMCTHWAEGGKGTEHWPITSSTSSPRARPTSSRFTRTT